MNIFLDQQIIIKKKMKELNSNCFARTTRSDLFLMLMLSVKICVLFLIIQQSK